MRLTVDVSYASSRCPEIVDAHVHRLLAWLEARAKQGFLTPPIGSGLTVTDYSIIAKELPKS